VANPEEVALPHIRQGIIDDDGGKGDVEDVDVGIIAGKEHNISVSKTGTCAKT